MALSPAATAPLRPLRRRLAFPITLIFALAAALFNTSAGAQGRTELIRGRVTGTDSVAIFGVRVTVFSSYTQLTRVSSTDSTGRYTVVFPNGNGDYLVSYTLPGYATVVRQVKRANDEDLLVSDVAMQLAPLLLNPIVVSSRGLLDRGAGSLPDSTGSWDWITGAGLTLSDMGNLFLMAGQLPGVRIVTDDDGRAIGISVFGLGSDQNIVLIDGVEHNFSDLPTEGMPTAIIATTNSDPSKGGFSGASVSVTTKPGSWQVTRSLGLTVDEPKLQFSDRLGRELGSEYSNVQLSGESSGPVVKDLLTYKGSLQLGQRWNDRATMLNTGPLGFAEVGASMDSVFRLRSVMQDVGIPLTASGIPGSQLSRNASLMLRGDFTPGGQHALNATLNTSFRRDASATSPLIAPARGGETDNATAALQVNHSFYFPFSILSESKVALSLNNSATDPYSGLPDARVRVNSLLYDGERAVATFQLGGNSAMPVTTRNTKWEFTNGLSWASKNNAHRIKLGTELRWDDFSQTQATNRLGTFSFNSLSDFEQGIPSDFRRQLTESHKWADLFTAALSLGDQWRKTKDFNIQYGLRVEIDRYGARPPYNADVERVFSARNDHAPNDVHVIPRLGFTWSYGTAPQIAAFEGAARGPRATVKGTLGEYRNTPGNSLLQSAMGATGLPDGIAILSCGGDAAPLPDWQSYAADAATIPEQCADGTGGTVFAERQPAVLLFGRDYQPQRSWRADLGWSGTALRRYKFSATGLVSLDRAQTGSIDLNFRDAERFPLSLEQNRPVYVEATSISARSGSVATKDSRLSTDFAKVTERRSDLKSATVQLNTSISPVVVSPRGVRWSLNYVYSRMEEYSRGFGSSTASNPLLRDWERGRGPDHQISASLNYDLFGFKLGLAARVTSGVRYTPMIRGDVNGDGESNDRAMVFAPQFTGDTAIASGMRSLLDHGPSGARACLQRQLGNIARSNSCTGPWSSVMNLSVALDPMKFVLPGRTTVQMTVGNAMTGMDLLLSGKANERVWGQRHSAPDATLLYVRGFDPDGRKFIYEVNPLFGSTRLSRAGQARPFVLTLRVSTDLSPPLAKQQLRRELATWQSANARRPSEAALKRQYTQPFTTMFESILRQKDTLRLTSAQAGSIAATTAGYVARIDSLWAPFAREMASATAPRVEEVHNRMQQLRRTSYEWMSVQAQAVKALLTSEQFNRLPQSYGVYFDERAMRRMR